MIINSLSLYIYTYMFYVHDYHLRTISISQQRKCFIKKKKKPKLYFHNDCVYFYLEFNKEDFNLRIKCFSKISNFSYYKDLEQQQQKDLAKKNYIGRTLQTNQTSIYYHYARLPCVWNSNLTKTVCISDLFIDLFCGLK